MNGTIGYYNENAEDYFRTTAGVDFTDTYDKFLKYLPPKGRIIDMGCGSGRDVKAFRDRGYDAIGLDASEELAQVARAELGIEVIVADMSTWITDEPYDGIWCCAALLHLHEEEADRFIQNLRYNLASGGVLYVSVKEGIETGPDGKGRYMRNYTEQELTQKLERAGLEILEIDKSGDLLGRDQFRWVNIFAIKKAMAYETFKRKKGYRDVEDLRNIRD